MVSTAIDELYRYLLGRQGGLVWIHSAERNKGVGRRGEGMGIKGESDDEGGESMGKRGVNRIEGKNKSREIKIESDGENGHSEYNGSEGDMKMGNGDQMDIENGILKGSGSKRSLGITGDSNAPSKKRRTKDRASKPSTRYETSLMHTLPN